MIWGGLLFPAGRIAKAAVRTAEIISTTKKAQRARKLTPALNGKPGTSANPLSAKPLKKMTPHQAGLRGRELARAKLLNKGFRKLGEEVRFYGRGEAIYTICDFVVSTADRTICVEVKYGSGHFTPNQLHYHRHKNAAGVFKGTNARKADLLWDEPRTVWMKQMCFKDRQEVACGLE